MLKAPGFTPPPPAACLRLRPSQALRLQQPFISHFPRGPACPAQSWAAWTCAGPDLHLWAQSNASRQDRIHSWNDHQIPLGHGRKRGPRPWGLTEGQSGAPVWDSPQGGPRGPGTSPLPPLRVGEPTGVSTAAPGPEQRRGLCSFLRRVIRMCAGTPPMFLLKWPMRGLMHQAEGQGTVAGTGREAPAPVPVGAHRPTPPYIWASLYSECPSSAVAGDGRDWKGFSCSH